jgi:hypothetical protein
LHGRKKGSRGRSSWGIYRRTLSWGRG